MASFGLKTAAFLTTTIVFATLSSQALATWPALLNADKSDDSGIIVKTDPGGNVYVAGTSTPPGGTSSTSLAKFDLSGKLQWYVPADYGTGKAPVAMSLDSNQNVFLFSKYKSGILSLTKYGSSGEFDWATFPGDVSNYPGTPTMAVGPDNKPVVAFGTRYLSGEARIVIRKYAPNAVPQWERTYTQPEKAPFTNTISIDSKNGIYVTGRLFIPGSGTAGILKYSSSGASEWQAGLSKGTTLVADGELDSNRNFVVLGEKSMGGGVRNSILTKFSSTGVPLWETVDNTLLNTTPVALAINSQGDAIVGAYSTAGLNSDLRTTKVDANGTLLWTRSYEGEGTMDNSTDRCIGVIVGKNDSVYVGGNYALSATQQNRYLLVKYSPTGIQKSVKTSSPGENVNAEASSIAYDPSLARVYLTGFAYDKVANRSSMYTVLYR